MKATATGNKFNQHNSIKASYLILGNVALNQTKIKQKIPACAKELYGLSNYTFQVPEKQSVGIFAVVRLSFWPCRLH